MAKEKYHKEILDNGITVVTEEIPYLKSASVGIWVKTGSRDEDNTNNGISHFLEHLAFKGTKRRTALQIAMEIDSIGGHIDAYTSREYTAYSAKILGEHLPIAIDILSDILIHSVFDRDEIEKERNVILEEIKMVEDSPSDYLFDLFYRNIWCDYSIGQPIQGTEATVKSITRDDILKYLEINYFPEKIIITAAGNIKTKQLIGMIDSSFGSLQGLTTHKEEKELPEFRHTIKMKQRDLEQVHFCIGVSGLKSNDDDRYKAYLMNIILGGSMSSRLFQQIREKKGLVYNIYSFNNPYEDTGLFGIYAGTSSKMLITTLQLISKEIKLLIDTKISETDMEKAKKQLKGNIALSLESSTSRMNQLARQEMYFGRHFTIDEINANIDRVTAEDTQKLAHKLFKDKVFAFAALGKLNGNNISIDMLRI